jgi:hypothetical protein
MSTTQTPEQQPEEIVPIDEYPDSDTELKVYRGARFLKTVRAVIQWYSNVGYFIILGNKYMVAVSRDNEDSFTVNLPDVP